MSARLQIVVSDKEKQKVENLVMRLSLYEGKKLSVSTFLSRSLMEVVDKLNDEIPNYNTRQGE